ncbi:hypothetical protein T05_9875 [Trichinella murrelli]|uniref:Uncharacterized protein n=1 Tax=Trichinella murrelli TaxID=144512 RepID=A0A0V0TIX9_9BILA|nr:hypothetical protein T05_9875 [Trichinella murrelli]
MTDRVHIFNLVISFKAAYVQVVKCKNENEQFLKFMVTESTKACIIRSLTPVNVAMLIDVEL